MNFRRQQSTAPMVVLVVLLSQLSLLASGQSQSSAGDKPSSIDPRILKALRSLAAQDQRGPAFSSINEQPSPSPSGLGRNDQSSSFNLDRRQSNLESGEFDVSPYFGDPSGRRPPLPPIIPPEALLFTQYPCSSLNSSVLVCDAGTRYRTLDGSCNNLVDPTFGRAFTKMQRIFSPQEDPTMMRRLAVSGNLLPSPRLISDKLRNVRTKNTQRDRNLLVMTLGQFIDHDLTLVPIPKNPTNPNAALRCGDCSSWVTHPGCAPIPIPLEDSFFGGQSSPRCLPFTRSSGLIEVGQSGYRYLEKINSLTPFLDLSAVYGSHECVCRRLRAYVGGKLLTTNTPASPYGLPVLAGKSSFADCKTKFEQCYNGGDNRLNENAALMAPHTLFLREHNHLARLLHELNPGWDDEQIFQEARLINIAQFQHLVTREFLPALLGNSPLLTQFGLLPTAYPTTYQPNLKPQIFHEFATSAFRVGHTLVPDHLPLGDVALRPMGSLPLFETFNNPSVMQDTMKGSFLDALTRGLLGTRLEGADLKVVDTLRDQLFVNSTNRFSGEDLFSLNIARGRDHAVASYTAYREPCRLDPVKSWEQLSPIIPREHVAKLREAYEHWDDIDLFPGGLAEDVVYDGLVGPTFGCIIAMQFYALKYGDRFWYDNDQGNLSPPQLDSIRQSGVLARLLGRNLDNSKSLVPSDALRLPSKHSNVPVPAEELAAVDLRPWLDRRPRRPPSCHYKGRDYGPGALVPISPCLDCHCGPEGSVACLERPIDCGLLGNFVPEAFLDDHCYRVCPPVHPPRPPFPSPHPHSYFRSAEGQTDTQQSSSP